MNIITVTDDNYAQHLGVTLCSLLENTSRYNEIRIFVVYHKISLENKNKLERLVKGYGSKIKFIKINPNFSKGLKISKYINESAYYRIKIPDLFPKFSKVLYLDCDSIIKKEIYDLYKTNLNDYYLAVVSDPGFKNYSRLNIPPRYKYFNSGIMLINLKKWRKGNISSEVINFIKNNEENIQWHDQDGLNAILYDKWLPLKPIWNQQRIFFKFNLKTSYFSGKDLEKAKKDPSIIHFTTSSKPWHFLDNHPFKNEYYYYLKKTPWKNYKPGDKTFLNIVKKLIKLLLQKMKIYY